MKKNKTSKNWLNKQKKDPFFRQSQIQGYRSRSAFKLIEMDKKFRFLHTNTNLLDLGSSPGGWSQVASKKIMKGKILAIDIRPMEKINNVIFVQKDFFKDIFHRSIDYKKISEMMMVYFNGKVDVVLSDMAVNTSGNKALDSYRIGELYLNAMHLAKIILSKNGVFLGKIFMGSEFSDIRKKAKSCFKKIVLYKPLSSKKESKEIYILCKGISKI